jgi:cytochrome c-type biogenesis protein CcmH/NrfF
MRVAALASVIFVLWAVPAAAGPTDLANEIASEVMSPYCEGVTLHDCPSRAAADLRNQIEQWAQQGWSKARIIGELEERFGEGIHGSPRRSQGIAAWVLPVVALVVGVIALAIVVPRWTKRPDDPVSVGPADHARVERELAALRKETQ